MAYLAFKIVARPYIGALAWVVFSLLNPHRMTWGMAYDFPFSLAIVILTVVGLALTRDEKKIKGGAPGVALVVFTVWICFTALFPLEPAAAWEYWARVMKIFAMTGVLLLLLHTKRHVELLTWTMVLCLGFYGVKGGIFTILSGGNYKVWGPPQSVIENNNGIAVALVMTIPLIVHLYAQYPARKWLQRALGGAAALSAVAVLGSWSRGALLAITAMGCLLWIRGTNKLAIFVGVLLFALVAVPFMPAQWFERMHTMEAYQEDGSAMSRLNTWETAWNIAKDRFPIGGGFEYQSLTTSARYSPNPFDALVAHSIYFQTIGSQGFGGLVLYLLFWALFWLQCGWIRRRTRDHPDLRWAFSLASMSQVSMVGYAVGGAFLNLAFWDMPYYMFALTGVTQNVVREELARLAVSKAIPARYAVSAGAGVQPAGAQGR